MTLPVKFPLLLAQGADGIAVGLASKILPHNFIELINAAIAHLQGRDFVLYPDFPTGGMIDVSRYNDGLRGGTVKVRARISKIDKRTLAITEIPYTTTTESIKDSIVKANEKGKIKIRKVDDNTAETGRNHRAGRARRVVGQDRSTRSTLSRTAKCRSPRMPASSAMTNPISWG